MGELGLVLPRENPRGDHRARQGDRAKQQDSPSAQLKSIYSIMPLFVASAVFNFCCCLLNECETSHRPVVGSSQVHYYYISGGSKEMCTLPAEKRKGPDVESRRLGRENGLPRNDGVGEEEYLSSHRRSGVHVRNNKRGFTLKKDAGRAEIQLVHIYTRCTYTPVGVRTAVPPACLPSLCGPFKFLRHS
eukprot:GHVT01062251.1.p1 GENE.GHVT01062251.1~~GHVT01062251.1.p1  ORF type:complete len:189 (-),score=19.50 GHVT01062251.1:897-1463(-)